MEQTARRQEKLPGAFNGATTNSQHGRVRWYLVHTPNGKERETCEKVRRIIPHELMQNAFVMQKEFWFKRDGAWSLQTKPMYKEYFFVATHDAAALDRLWPSLSFGCRIAGSRERAYAPMPDDAQDWYRSVLDDDDVVRNSVARIEDGVLHIEQGPLVGQEARVHKIDRRKRWCLVDVGEGDSSFREVLPLDVPIKRKGDVAPAIHLFFEFVDGGGVPGDRDVSFIVTANKEMTESRASMGDALLFDQIKPSGTLGYRIVKRLFDLVFSLLMSVLLLIPVAAVCALIRLESSGSPMYAQERIGKGGKTIKILKLRSMVADAGNVQKYLSPEQLHQWEVERKVDDDPRITKVGQFIRKCSIDEMPQFLNVLNGDLSVIGPRPITRDELEQHFSDEEKAELLSVQPGITGLWQATDRNAATFESGLRQKIELHYVRNRCFRMDWKCFTGTFGAMFGKKRTGR